VFHEEISEGGRVVQSVMSKANVSGITVAIVLSTIVADASD
jgi:hypothetical protein